MTDLQFILLIAFILANSAIVHVVIWSAYDKIIAAIKEEFKP